MLSASAAPQRALPNDAYVWQKRWTPAVTDALAASSGFVARWRVLAAQSNEAGRLQPVAFDAAALQRSGRPTVLVIRIEGQLARWDAARLEADFAQLLQRWRDALPGGFDVEFDHDAGTARLDAYGAFLRAARLHLGAGQRLSITALPTWMGSPAFAGVLQAIDEAVLQVHAVSDPRTGLFDPSQAEKWVARMGRISPVAFRVALPTYGVRVAWAPDGRIAAVAAEQHDFGAWNDARELRADPQVLADFARRLKADPPRGLVGIAWFRLPTDSDRRAWSAATWRNVATGAELRSGLAVALTQGPHAGLTEIALVNRGNVDAMLPARIALPRRCRLSDGFGRYRLAWSEAGPSLERLRDGTLKPASHLPIGWTRCALEEGDLDVAP